MNDETMLPCPFCGGAAEIESTGTMETSARCWQSVWVECTACGVTTRGIDVDEGDSSQPAIDRWNTRAPASAPEGEAVAEVYEYPREHSVYNSPMLKGVRFIVASPPVGTKLYTRSNAKAGEVCAWTQDEDDGSWDTACGNKHEFMAGGPEENEHKFCPYCGNTLSTHDKTKA